MNTKKIIRLGTLVILMAIAVPASSAIIVPPVAASSPVPENARGVQLLHRLEDIRNMDKSTLTRSEKKGLRKEVKEIRKEMKAIKGGVYLSVGAIIIIILLLILIL